MTVFIFLASPYLIFLDAFIAIMRYEMKHYDYWVDDYLKDIPPPDDERMELCRIVASNNAEINALIRQNRISQIRIVK